VGTSPRSPAWHTANPNAGATLCPGDHLYERLRRDVSVLTRLLSW
jgi:hypothetical protein